MRLSLYYLGSSQIQMAGIPNLRYYALYSTHTILALQQVEKELKNET